MTTPNPITPPPELVQQWWEEADQHQRSGDNAKTYFDYVATEAAQWGANLELEACCEWLCAGYADTAEHLRAARRPKLPTLKDQALALINRRIGDGYVQMLTGADADTIRRALDALPND
jgi:hypothetical protein